MSNQGHDYDYGSERADAGAGAGEPDAGLPGADGSDQARAAGSAAAAGATGARVRWAPELETGRRAAPGALPESPWSREAASAPAAGPDAPATARPGRTLLWAGIVAVAVLAIIVAAAAVFLLRPDAPDAAPATTTPAASSAPGGSAGAPAGPPVDIHGVSIAAVSVDPGITAVGRGEKEVRPDGEFIAVELEITNGSDVAVLWNGDMELVDAGGTAYAPSPEASMRYDSDAEMSTTIRPGETATVVQVYDVPIGTKPAEGRIALSGGSGGGTGSVSLTS